ncbi:MAG: NHL repeat-containing protein [Chloroflexi bacterium]|nr:NHL repeat-containing protein [Chloroflexota bacterium]
MTTQTQPGRMKHLITIGFCADVGGRGFHLPNSIALRSDGRIYVMSRSSQAHPLGTRMGMCDLNDEFYGEFGSRGTGDGQFIGPTDIAFDSSDRLFLADEQLNRITIYDADGNFLEKWGTPGNEPGQISGPSGLAFDSHDTLYITDQWNHRVQKFTPDGNYLGGWGERGKGDGQFNMPWGITVDNEDDVYIVDWRNDRIQKFTSEGEHLLTFGTPGREEGQLDRPADVTVGPNGTIYVADWGNQRVQAFDPEGGFLQLLRGEATMTRWGREYLDANDDESRARESYKPYIDVDALTPHEASARVEPYFWNPIGVETDSEGRLYVADAARHRFQVYEPAK